MSEPGGEQPGWKFWKRGNKETPQTPTSVDNSVKVVDLKVRIEDLQRRTDRAPGDAKLLTQLQSELAALQATSPIPEAKSPLVPTIDQQADAMAQASKATEAPPSASQFLRKDTPAKPESK